MFTCSWWWICCLGSPVFSAASKIQGSLHCAADDGTVRCFGRDDVLWFGRDDALWFGRDDALWFGRDDVLWFGRDDVLWFGRDDVSAGRDAVRQFGRVPTTRSRARLVASLRGT